MKSIGSKVAESDSDSPELAVALLGLLVVDEEELLALGGPVSELPT